MAIDTAAKRRSAVCTRRLPWFRRFWPAPDGSMTQEDRQQLAFVYVGILAEQQQEGIPIDAADVPHRTFDWTAQKRPLDATTKHRSMDWTGQKR